MKKTLICLLALFLFACNAATQTSAPLEPASPPITQTPSVISEKPTGLPTFTPFPTEVTAFAPTLIIPTIQAGRAIQLSSIHMIDSQIGWGIFWESGEVLRPGFPGYFWRQEGYILRTTDGGKTWQNVTPPTGAYSSGGFFALDANTAWASSNVPCCINHNTAQLWRTRDGGKTWQASQPFSIKIKDEIRSEFYVPIQI